MKKQLFSLFIIFAFSHSLNAQKIKGHKEKIQNLKISYLTNQLDLTSTEAEKFWPVYNQHVDYKRKLAIRKSRAIKKELKVVKSIDNLKEEGASVLFELLQGLDRKKFDGTQQYYTKLRSIISVKKILKLQLAEKEFSRKLMRKYKHKNSKNDKKKGSK